MICNFSGDEDLRTVKKGEAMRPQRVSLSTAFAASLCGLACLTNCSGGSGKAGGDAAAGGTTDGAVAATGTRPCDIYAAGNTPCVAAHSMARALYGAYNGNLYQVRRLSDQTTQDIGVLTPGGFANAAAQDTFCANTTCTVSVIYDQSPQANHLTSAPAGGYVKTPDREVNADRFKLTVSGHTVYGAYFDAGMGYRNNKTNGVATGDQPQSMYMVASGIHYNDQCCFDYGNAETTNNDDGNGTMEAVYLGNCSIWSKGTGSGPWVMADLENGLFAGQAIATNPNNLSLAYDYVTAMVKGKPGGFAIKGGNAQAGALQTMYDGPRPANGYDPMQKQGAIILGIGGDNSNGAIGIFFEGCMTAGYSSDAVDDAIQANIVAAGYGPGITGGNTCGPKCTKTSTCVPTVVPAGLTMLTDFSSNLDSNGIFHTGGLTDWNALFGGMWIAPAAPDPNAPANPDPCAPQSGPPAHPLVQSLADGNWHITGTIASGEWAGGGLWFGSNCPVLDFSAYKGISFTISGEAGPSASITIGVGTASNTRPNTDTTSKDFTCLSNSATCTLTTCSGTSASVSGITAAPQTVRLLWSDFGGGSPNRSPNPAEITGITVNPTLDFSGSASPYTLDIVIDDLALIP
jgi:non-reducing end alpha-L-arabinofuranosidase